MITFKHQAGTYPFLIDGPAVSVASQERSSRHSGWLALIAVKWLAGNQPASWPATGILLGDLHIKMH
jgi:hypothetical protein